MLAVTAGNDVKKKSLDYIIQYSRMGQNNAEVDKEKCSFNGVPVMRDNKDLPRLSSSVMDPAFLLLLCHLLLLCCVNNRQEVCW